MGLYLCIFDEDEELDGVEVGPYDDFDKFRSCVVREIEDGNAGSKFPTLILHSDCDGAWSPSEAGKLEGELAAISDEFRRRLPTQVGSEWQMRVMKNFGLQFGSLYDCFFDVDGEPLLERLTGLARLSQKLNLPILFQ